MWLSLYVRTYKVGPRAERVNRGVFNQPLKQWHVYIGVTLNCFKFTKQIIIFKLCTSEQRPVLPVYLHRQWRLSNNKTISSLDFTNRKKSKLCLNYHHVVKSPQISGLRGDLSPGRLIKTHHYIIIFDRPLYSKPGTESYCWSSTDQL